MNIVYNTDCIEAIRHVPDQSFQLAVCDPPYGIRVSHNMGRRRGDAPSPYKKADWDAAPPPSEFFLELQRVSVNQIIWGADHFISRIPNPDNHQWVCWDKKFSEHVSFSSFELAWTSFPGASKRIALSSSQADRLHPTQKPVALYSWLFSRFTKPGDKVLDTHLGSGSSRIAAFEAGLDFVGMEIDPEYCEAQERRFQNHIMLRRKIPCPQSTP